MLQFSCASIMCLGQYLGLGTVLYTSDQAVVYQTQQQTYQCTKYNQLYTCTKDQGLYQ
jgi:hypothetical protein